MRRSLKTDLATISYWRRDTRGLRLEHVVSDPGVTGGVLPASISRTELVTLLADSPDSLRYQGALPNHFFTKLGLPVSSLNRAKDFDVDTR